jgi:hypothetical protein
MERIFHFVALGLALLLIHLPGINSAPPPPSPEVAAALADGRLSVPEYLTRAGYQIVPLKYFGPAAPGGVNVTIEGTVQEIHAELTRLNPNFDRDFPARPRPSLSPQVGPTSRSVWDLNIVNHFCNLWEPANIWTIWEGIDYLSRLPSVYNTKLI